jgi:hypothetical protein
LSLLRCSSLVWCCRMCVLLLRDGVYGGFAAKVALGVMLRAVALHVCLLRCAGLSSTTALVVPVLTAQVWRVHCPVVLRLCVCRQQQSEGCAACSRQCSAANFSFFSLLLSSGCSGYDFKACWWQHPHSCTYGVLLCSHVHLASYGTQCMYVYCSCHRVL